MITFCCNCSASREFEDNVCTECGLEIKEDILVIQNQYDKNFNENNNHSTHKRPFYLKTNKYDDFLRFLTPLRNFTLFLCKGLKCAKHVQKGSLAWVEKVFKHERFRHLRVPNKQVVCVVIVFLVSRSWHVSISLWHMKKALPVVYFKGFCKWKFIVADIFKDLGKFDVVMTKIEMADNKCNSMKLSLTCRQKVHDLLGLLDKLWVCEGVGSESLVVVCCYVAWVAESPIERIKISVESFCRLHDVAYNSTTKNNLSVVLTSLDYLHQQLPWVNTEDNDNINNINKKKKNKKNWYKNNNNANEEIKKDNSSNYFIDKSIENKTNCVNAKVNKEIFFHLDDIIMYGGVSVDNGDEEDDDDEEKDKDYKDDHQEDDNSTVKNYIVGVNDDYGGDADEFKIEGDDDKDDNNDVDYKEDGKTDNLENKVTYNNKRNNKKNVTENIVSNNNNVVISSCYNDNEELSVVADELLEWRRWKRKKNEDDDSDDIAISTVIPSTTDLYREEIDECDMCDVELQSYLNSKAQVCAIKRIKKSAKKMAL